ncbi:MAG: hypothetical protein JRI23_27295 [Deltaproteobacteria bacterium]|jgi:hypothetical protein|nr:hypothetical protein [Deltaproteobacteria bacterium]
MVPKTSLANLTDDELVASLHELVGASRNLTARIVEHLVEIEARELHLAAGCSSLFDYCMRVLGFDEAAAYNRIHVARQVRRFPLLLELIADGRLHLTGARLLGPHLTEDGHRDLLQAAAGKTKREIERLIAEQEPEPDAPDRIRKRPARRRRREKGREGHQGGAAQPALEAAPHREVPAPKAGASASKARDRALDRGRSAPLAADRYKIEFTGSAELVAQLDRVRALMAHRAPGAGLEVIVAAALDLLEAEILRERFGIGAKPRRPSTARPGATKTTRHVPRAVTREVYERDGLRCAFVDPKSGRRCTEQAVELQHHEPFGCGGEHNAANVSLYCKPHNAYAARRDYGREHIEAAIGEARIRSESHRRRQAASRTAPPPVADTSEAIQLPMFSG